MCISHKLYNFFILSLGLLVSFLPVQIVKCDLPEKWQLGMQDPASPIAEGIIDFHGHLLFFIVLVGCFVVFLLARVVVLFSVGEGESRSVAKFSHNVMLEVVWTVVPALILLLIAGPSFSLLYSTEDVRDPCFTFKIQGHQWYWHYDYPAVDPDKAKSFDSYMLKLEDLDAEELEEYKGAPRLLQVDQNIVVPSEVNIRGLVTSGDVLHSWAVPSLGVKVDACPGRLNEAYFHIKREGTFYGQCSEICGVNHGFMPIVVEAVSLKDFEDWQGKEL